LAQVGTQPAAAPYERAEAATEELAEPEEAAPCVSLAKITGSTNPGARGKVGLSTAPILLVLAKLKT
jgi:hypothetical protein